MNCMNQHRGMQDVAATANTASIHSLIQLHEIGRDTMTKTTNSSSDQRNRHIHQLSVISKVQAPASAAAQYEAHEKYVEGNCVLVAVNAAKISRHALEWALTNVVQPGDHITLLALWPTGGRRLWSLALISRDCARRTIARRGGKLNGGKPQDVEEEISDCCSCMMQELRSLCNSKKAEVSVKIVPDGERGAIALEAQRIGASWVVLDKHVMKKEGKMCLEQLKCNLVMVKQSKSSKILRLNLRGSANTSKATLNTDKTSLINDHAGIISKGADCHLRNTQIGSAKGADKSSGRRGASRLSSASKRRASLRLINVDNLISFYEGDASFESSDPDQNPLAAAGGNDSFTTGSETDSSARENLQYIGALCAQLQLNSNEYSGSYSEEDILLSSSSCEMSNLGDAHSGPLCTPATASPSSEAPPFHTCTSLQLQKPGIDLTPFRGQQTCAQGMGDSMVGLFREAWKPAPCIITCGSSSSNKANSTSTTPKSDTLTLTGSSYPKPSRSPSPSTNHHAPPLSPPSNQHAPPLPCLARASRSPSPSKSSTSNAGVNVKLSSSSASSNLLYSATTAASTPKSRPLLIPSPVSAASSSSKLTASRRHDIIRSGRQAAPLPHLATPSGNSTCNYSSVAHGTLDKEATTRELMQRFSEWDHQGCSKQKSSSSAASSSLYSYSKDQGIVMDQLNDLERTSSVRRAMSMMGSSGVVRHPAPAGPPPLCSICQHKAPVFGKPPRRFSYAELELATGGFSKANFLAEGGFGSVHRGVLPDGQAVAVKQHKLASSQGDNEFCSEVEVLSCAQHRNVVMLIGYCIEHCRRLLVYEFICNGSLDSHLYGSIEHTLPWAARQKIAVGAARGLRYLHEECRVGCIIHRDMRPNNILLTHDYEPMVGDFGLARWQPDGDLGVQTRVIGTFGYLAPEYAQSGEVTEKADVYSFGVVLLELVTGRKAVDLARPKGQQCLTEWARPLLEQGANMRQLIDPRLLEREYGDYELFCSLHAASLCVRKDPHLRPRMSQVLRILEGDVIIDTSGPSTASYFYTGPKLAAAYQGDQPAGSSFNGSKSSRVPGEYQRGGNPAGNVSPPLISYSGSILSSTCATRVKGLRTSSYSNLAYSYANKRHSFEDS